MSSTASTAGTPNRCLYDLDRDLEAMTDVDRPQGYDLVDALETLAFGLVAITSRAVAEETSHGQLTLQQWRVLVVLGAVDDGLRVSELSGRIGASGPSTSRIARRLEIRNLVATSVDPADGRAIRLHLTPTGLALRERIILRRRALIEVTIAGGDASPDLAHRLAAMAREFDRWT